MKSLQPYETELRGVWIARDGAVCGDVTCERINWLVEHKLKMVAYSKDYGAWETLYRDSADGRYWEKVYPQSHMHGGGPPTLRCISKEDATIKYGIRR